MPRVSESCGLAVKHSAHDQKVMGSIPVLDGSGVKAMPGSIPTYTQLWFIIEKKENTGSQMSHTKKIF